MKWLGWFDSKVVRFFDLKGEFKKQIMRKKKTIIRGVKIKRGEKYAGFTSGLFWHFTGGPIINIGEIKKREEVQGEKRKTTSEATKILLEILKSKTLKATSEEHLFPNKDESFKTLPFCCVTDIPFKRLHLHSQYYGRVTIGFKPEEIYDNFYPIRYDNTSDREFNKVHRTIVRFNERADKLRSNVTKQLIDDLIAEILFDLSLCKRTTFDTDFNKSFYYEREWRCFEDFEFEPKDVGAIIVPDTKRLNGKESFYDNVITSKVYTTEYNQVPVIPWKLIMEL